METLEVEVELDEPTFWGAVGWPGIALYGLALAVAGTHVYIAAEYTFYMFCYLGCRKLAAFEVTSMGKVAQEHK